MQAEFIVAAAVHVLFAVFWAGTTLALALTGGGMAVRLFRSQMGAAIVAIVAGGYLWKLTHAGPFGQAEQVLSTGILCALVALGVQAALVGPALRQLRGETTREAVQKRVAIAYQISAGLLVITILAMASARFV